MITSLQNIVTESAPVAEHAPAMIDAARWATAAISFIFVVALVWFIRYQKRQMAKIAQTRPTAVWVVKYRDENDRCRIQHGYLKESDATDAAALMTKQYGEDKVEVVRAEVHY